MATRPLRPIPSTARTPSLPTLNLYATTTGERPCLAVLVGPAGAGKTTFAVSSWPGPALSLDECRRRVSPYGGLGGQSVTTGAVSLWHGPLRQRLETGESVCADATSIVSEHRASH